MVGVSGFFFLGLVTILFEAQFFFFLTVFVLQLLLAVKQCHEKDICHGKL